MLKVEKKPYNLLLITAFILLCSSFFLFSHNSVLDVYVYDTYFVISHRQAFWFLAISSFVIWLLYLFTNKILLSRSLTSAHLIITIIKYIFFAVTFYFDINIFNPKHRRYSSGSVWTSFETFGEYNRTVAIIMGILVLGQLIFIVNIIAGPIKKGLYKPNN